MRDLDYIKECVEYYVEQGKEFSMLENIIFNCPESEREGIARMLQKELVKYSFPDEGNKVFHAILELENYKRINRSKQIRNVLGKIKEVEFSYCVKLIDRFQKYCIQISRQRNIPFEYENGEIKVHVEIFNEAVNSYQFKVLREAVQGKANTASRKYLQVLESII